MLISVTHIAAHPTPIDKELSKHDEEIDYTLRNWGDSPLPYSVSYSQHARDLYFSSTMSTIKPTTQSRVKRVQGRRFKKNRGRTTSTTTTEKHFIMPLLFGSSGWGPSR